MNHCRGIEISILFVTLSSVHSKALLTVLNFSFRYLWHLSVYRVLFKAETVWVRPILKLSKISFTNALFQVSFPKLLWKFAVDFVYFSQVHYPFWILEISSFFFHSVHHKFIVVSLPDPWYSVLLLAWILFLIICLKPLDYWEEASIKSRP
jgi:hypothetical protein